MDHAYPGRVLDLKLAVARDQVRGHAGLRLAARVGQPGDVGVHRRNHAQALKWPDHTGVGDHGRDEVCEWALCWWRRHLHVGVEVKPHVLGEESTDVHLCGAEHHADGVHTGLAATLQHEAQEQLIGATFGCFVDDWQLPECRGLLVLMLA